MRNATGNFGVIRSQVGSTLVELMVTVGIVTGVLGVGVLSLDRGYMNLPMAQQGLVNDLRRARMEATLKGAHYRFETASSHYVITRLSDSDGDGVWEVNQEFNPKTIDLPAGFSVAVSAGGASSFAEFDGRGLLVPEDDGSVSIVTVTITGGSGKSGAVKIWPSGQVEQVEAGGSVTTG